MEPISSNTLRISTNQPTPAQQKRGEEAITAVQPPSDRYAASAPGQELQLQRRQIVEDIGKNQQLSAQLQDTGQQLQAAKALADQASSGDISNQTRNDLNQRYTQIRDQLSAPQANRNASDTQRIPATSSIATAPEAKETSETLEGALSQLDDEVQNLADQNRTLGSDFPRSPSNGNSNSAVSSAQSAQNIADRLRSNIQSEPLSAISSQATVSKQTALTLFQ